MPVLVDTGVLIGWLHERDALHPEAQGVMQDILQGRHGLPLGLDLVLAEGLTYLGRKPHRRPLSEAFSEIFLGSSEGPALLRLVSTPQDLLREARGLHFQHYDRRLSMTDCALIAHGRASGAVVATFDGGFEGLVPTIRGA